MPSCVWANTKNHKDIFQYFICLYLGLSWVAFKKPQTLEMWCIIRCTALWEGLSLLKPVRKKKKALWSQYCSNPASSPPSWIIKLDLYDCIYWWGIGHAKMRSMQIQIFREVSWLALIFFFKYKKYLTYVVMYKKNFYIKIWILICFHVL